MDVKQLLQDFNPSKKVMSYLLVAAVLGIGLSFGLGRKYTKSESKIDNIEKIVTENKGLITQNKNFILKTNIRIDSLQKNVTHQLEDGYRKGSEIMNVYQKSVNEQLDFLIKHNGEDRELIKEALDLRRNSTDDEINRVIDQTLNRLEQEKYLQKEKELQIGVFEEEPSVSVIKIEDYKKETNVNDIRLNYLKENFKVLKIDINDNGSYNVSYMKK
jgi:hypothetical protein